MKFVATFGQKYRHEPHPVLNYVDVDGFVLIFADDMNEAVTKLQAYIGPAYAFTYPYNTEEEQAKVDRFNPNGSFLEL